MLWKAEGLRNGLWGDDGESATNGESAQGCPFIAPEADSEIHDPE
jgi:hypothetical protein